MIHKISCNTEKRNENHRNNPGELKLVPTVFIYDINHEACRKKEGKPKVKFQIFFQAKNKKGHYEDLYGNEKKVDYDAAINASIKKLETFFVFDIFKFFCICVFHSIYIIKLMKGFVSILMAFLKRKNVLLNYSIEYVQKQYEILSFDASAANIYSDLYERLKSQGTPAQRFDLLIASIAISNNLILVTRNVSDFTAIVENSNLMIEEW